MAYPYSQSSGPDNHSYPYYPQHASSPSGSYPMATSSSQESHSSRGSGSTSGYSSFTSEVTTVSPSQLQICTGPYNDYKPPVSPTQPQQATSPTSPGGRNPAQYPCLWPNCSSKGRFKRATDLKRHVRTQHNAEQYLIDCKHRWCGRVGEKGFTRTDHYRDHLREVHRETIAKAQTRKTK